MRSMRILFWFLSAALVLLVGCSDDDPTRPAPPVEPSVLPFPSSPAILMENFVTAYDSLSIAWLTDLLHPDHETLLNATTTTLYPELGSELDLTEELTIHANMFSGQPGTGPQGEFEYGIVGVIFQIFEQQNEWALSSPESYIPNTLCSLYDVGVLFDRGEGASYLRVTGAIKFYVTSRDSLHEGEMQPFYQLRGQEDLTLDSKAEETFCWGSVKALFR